MGFMKWSSRCPKDQRAGASGTGWETPWRGRFMLVHTPGRYVTAAVWRAVLAMEATRPARIVIICGGDMNLCDLERAEWVASGQGKTIAMFQNGMAETTTPSRELITDMLQEMRLPPPRWGRKTRCWKQPPVQAWALNRRGERRGGVLRDHWGLFDVAQSTIYAPPPRATHVSDEFNKHFRVGLYARQVGLVAPGYSIVIGHAMQEALGYRPSLQAVETAMTSIRGRMWDGARACFEAAREARRWAYTADPDCLHKFSKPQN